jgi:molybdopterin synthase catalytic subunit
VGEQIVFVGTTSLHRQDAYAANEFIMDFLKVNAPFWKKETTQQGETWLDAKQSDNIKAKHWKSD